MEIVKTVLAVLYGATGVVAVIGYLPTLRDLTRRISSANILSYVIWTVTTGIGFLYALLVVTDALLVVVTGLNFALCGAVLGLAIRVRRGHGQGRPEQSTITTEQQRGDP